MYLSDPDIIFNNNNNNNNNNKKISNSDEHGSRWLKRPPSEFRSFSF
jgi:hypothetical protein